MARQTPLGARPNRDPLAWPALDPGRLLEVVSDGDPRGMTVLDKTRLIDRLSSFLYRPATVGRFFRCVISS